MTTRTRTTRKAPWAVVTTVLVALVGLLFGLLAAVVPAAADDVGSGEGGNPDVVCAGYTYKADGLSGFAYTIQSLTAGGITDWCLKAGQTREYGNGGYAETVTVTASGKYEISHVAWNEGTRPLVPASQQFCVAPLGTTTFGYDTFGTTDNTTPQSTWTNGSGQPLSAYVVGTTADCTPPPPPLVPASQQFCVAPLGTTTFGYDTFGTTDNTTPQSTWTNGSGQPLSAYVVGTTADCTPPPPPPAEPEPATVAPVQPATVAPVQPATVAVPAAATVPLPASIPAGDGSGIPATPVWPLVLLTLGTATVIATGTRLAMARNR